MKAKRLRDAMNEIEQALRIKPRENIIDGKSLLRRAQIYKDLGDFDKAEQDC